MVLLDSSDNFGENEVLFGKIGAKVLDLWLDTPCLWKLVLGFWTYGLISPLPKAMCPSCSKPVFRPKTPNATALGSKVLFYFKLHKILNETSPYFQILGHLWQIYLFRRRQLNFLLYRQSGELFWVNWWAK